VILAGGRGKRMASTSRHKVCFPILGTPAIVRAVDVYKAAGLRHFIVVVGQMAEQVISTLAAAHPDVTFVYQDQPRGTGHAAMLAAEALSAQGFGGNVMLVMGDKVTRPPVVRRLIEQFESSDADAVLTAAPKSPDSTSGRIVHGRDGKVLGIVELPDILQARRRRRKLQLAGVSFSAARIERLSRTVNVSMYMFRFERLRRALGRLRADNVQGELYLTDTIEHIARAGRVDVMVLDDPTELMAYNTPQELMAVEAVLMERERPRISLAPKRRGLARFVKPVRHWLRILDSSPPSLRRQMRRIYGDDPDSHRECIGTAKRLLQRFARMHGLDRPVLLCRAPGRVNLMGRHVDHRGGFVNVMAINRETLLVAGPRDDDVVTLNNMDPKRFGPREFRIGQLLQGFSWSDWLEFLGSRTAQSVIQNAPGDWSHYARAPLLRLQHECRGVRLRGMDCLVTGNIPMGAGLSSSSALVVAFAEAAVALNQLNVAMLDFIDLCGEGEWFVGSRGGSADHAAIRTSSAGYISRMGFFPFHKAGDVRFPSQMRLVIAHSGSQAVKSAGARDIYNQRVACYEIAQMLLKLTWPAARGIEHLRDLSPQRLKVSAGEIYRALMRLPDRPSRNQLRALVHKEDRDRLERIFATHANLGGYDLRGVSLYGISECLRSELFADVIKRRDFDRVGRFMRASHDGDRVVRLGADGRLRRHIVRMDDRTLERLAESNAELTCQCGRYACSTASIDQLVDIADSIEGVVGAQLAGAGLGGCVMILVRAEALDTLLDQLRRRFYRPREQEFEVHVCRPAAGAGLIRP